MKYEFGTREKLAVAALVLLLALGVLVWIFRPANIQLEAAGWAYINYIDFGENDRGQFDSEVVFLNVPPEAEGMDIFRELVKGLRFRWTPRHGEAVLDDSSYSFTLVHGMDVMQLAVSDRSNQALVRDGKYMVTDWAGRSREQWHREMEELLARWQQYRKAVPSTHLGEIQ